MDVVIDADLGLGVGRGDEGGVLDDWLRVRDLAQGTYSPCEVEGMCIERGFGWRKEEGRLIIGLE